MLSFGPNGSFFFGSPRAWRWWVSIITSALTRLWSFTGSGQIYQMVWPKRSNSIKFNNHTVSHLVRPIHIWWPAWEQTAKTGSVRFSSTIVIPTSTDSPTDIWHEKELNDWLSAAGQDFSSLEVSLSATRDGFWACSNLGYRWHGLPSGLEKELQSRLKPDKPAPIQIGLGANDSWIVLYAPSRYGPSQRNHCSSANLVGLYPALWEIIQNDVVTVSSILLTSGILINSAWRIVHLPRCLQAWAILRDPERSFHTLERPGEVVNAH